MAGPATTTLAGCLADSTNGKDRKLMARWIFISMAAHPEMAALSTVTPQIREDASRQTAALMTRLLSKDCPNQVRAAVAQDGQGAVTEAFSSMGRVAMTELMSNPAVMMEVREFANYVDMQELSKVMTLQ